jgi:hypothetical protein
MLGLRKLRGVVAGIFKGDEAATGGNGIGSSKHRFRPRLAIGLDQLAQPPHRKFDILRLQCSRQLSTSVSYRSFGKRWKYSAGKRWKYSAASFLAAVRPREFLADERVSWHRLTPEKRNGPSSGELEAVMELADTVPGEVFNCDRDR